MAAADPKPSLVGRLFDEHRGALLAFFRRRIRSKAAAELNRYSSKPIDITTPELRDLEITGTFSIDDSEEFLALLRSLDGVQVDVTATQIRVSKK